MSKSMFRRDDRGSTTVEFMFFVPLIFMWFAALFVFFQGFHGWMKATKATYAISDMLSRQTEIDDAFIVALDGVFDAVSQSENTDASWLRVSSVRKRDDILEIMWSTETASGSPASIDVADIQDHIPNLINNEYVVLVESYRPFNPVFSWVGIDDMVFENHIATPLRFSGRLINSDQPEDNGSTGGVVDDHDIPTDEPA